MGAVGTVSLSSVRIHPAALEEAQAAVDWYRQRSPRAAARFLDELDRTMERIRNAPSEFPGYDFGTRAAILRRFPYLVIFRETAAGAEIIAVAHGRRRPRYWQDRIG